MGPDGDESPGGSRCLLLGSGEFEPWVSEAESLALEGSGGDGSVAVLATASAPEGEAVFDRWQEMALTHYAEMGLRARALPLRTRSDAEDPEIAARLADCSMVFFSGGNPEYLATTLRATRSWAAILAALEGGAVYGGCSAGAMVAGSADGRHRAAVRFQFSGGLGLCPRTVFGVHWDSVFMRLLRPAVQSGVPEGHVLIGIAERSAILSRGGPWEVYGSGLIEVRQGSAKSLYRAGDSFSEGLPQAQ